MVMIMRLFVINSLPKPTFAYCSLYYWEQNIHYDEWDETTYQFLNFNGCTVEF